MTGLIVKMIGDTMEDHIRVTDPIQTMEDISEECEPQALNEPNPGPISKPPTEEYTQGPLGQ